MSPPDPSGPYPPVPIPTVPGCSGNAPAPMPPVGPGPGPRPTAPVFPYHEARAALRALDELIDEVGLLAARNQTLTYGLITDGSFHGSARDRFEANVDEATNQLVPITTEALHDDREWLVQAIATADIRQDGYEQDLQAWRYRRAHPNPSLPV